MSNSDENRQRVKAIEQKIKLLVTLGIAQTILLAVILVMLLMDQLLPDWSTLIMFALIAGVLGYVFRNQLPGILGQVSRFVFARLSATQKNGSTKDIS